MEKVFAAKGENRRLWTFLSNLWKRRVEDVGETEKTIEEITMSWQQYERRKARKHRGEHVGGPGKEDYRRGNAKGEIKHMKRRMTKPELMRLRKRGISEIDALGGFTGPAKEYAQKRKMKLFHRGRRVT